MVTELFILTTGNQSSVISKRAAIAVFGEVVAKEVVSSVDLIQAETFVYFNRNLKGNFRASEYQGYKIEKTPRPMKSWLCAMIVNEDISIESCEMGKVYQRITIRLKIKETSSSLFSKSCDLGGPHQGSQK